jgi:hypothetical protein
MHGEHSGGLGFRPVLVPVSGAQFAAIDAGGLLNRPALVGRRLAASDPVADGLVGFAELVGERLSPADPLDRDCDASFLVHRSNVHAPCTSRQQAVSARPNNLCMDDQEELSDAQRAWRQVNEELAARAEKHQTPGDWHALGRALLVARNTANNWRERKRLPPDRWQAVADYFGWTVDYLLGRELPPDRGGRSQEEPATPLIHTQGTGLSRDDFLRIYDNLTSDETQLLARLMSALGWASRAKVEVKLWKKDPVESLKNRAPYPARGDFPAPSVGELASLKLVRSKGRKGKAK